MTNHQPLLRKEFPAVRELLPRDVCHGVVPEKHGTACRGNGRTFRLPIRHGVPAKLQRGDGRETQCLVFPHAKKVQQKTVTGLGALNLESLSSFLEQGPEHPPRSF